MTLVGLGNVYPFSVEVGVIAVRHPRNPLPSAVVKLSERRHLSVHISHDREQVLVPIAKVTLRVWWIVDVIEVQIIDVECILAAFGIVCIGHPGKHCGHIGIRLPLNFGAREVTAPKGAVAQERCVQSVYLAPFKCAPIYRCCRYQGGCLNCARLETDIFKSDVFARSQRSDWIRVEFTRKGAALKRHSSEAGDSNEQWFLRLVVRVYFVSHLQCIARVNFSKRTVAQRYANLLEIRAVLIVLMVFAPFGSENVHCLLRKSRLRVFHYVLKYCRAGNSTVTVFITQQLRAISQKPSVSSFVIGLYLSSLKINLFLLLFGLAVGHGAAPYNCKKRRKANEQCGEGSDNACSCFGLIQRVCAKNPNSCPYDNNDAEQHRANCQPKPSIARTLQCCIFWLLNLCHAVLFHTFTVFLGTFCRAPSSKMVAGAAS